MTKQDELTGIELQGKRGRYQLKKLLGAGLTARVYLADAYFEGNDDIDVVAIKVMRPGLGEEEKRRFRAEGEHLAGLLSHGAEAAPIYYEIFETNHPEAPEVLVLELMSGRPVQEIIQEDGKFAESDGLILARQLAQLLEVLHEKMQQTYTDLKFENLWWSVEKKQLKVTDWNVLSEPGDLSRVSSDLLRASRYIYTTLTGGEVREKGGIVVTPFMRHPNWSQLSLATQHVLQKALHRNPERRYPTAAKLKGAFDDVLWFWEKNLRHIGRRIQALIGGEYNRSKYEEALRGLDVWRLRRDSGVESFSYEDQSKLDDLLFQVGDRLSKEKTKLERGVHLFRGNSFKEAAVLFKESQEDDPWDMRAWRWREAASAGVTTSEFQNITREVEQALDALNAKEFLRAEQILRRLNVLALQGIAAEARTRRLLAEGEKLAADGQALVDAGKGDTPEAEELFNKAQQAFGAAADALAAITPKDYREQVQEELGDIATLGRALVDERRSAAAQSVAKMRAAEGFYQSEDWASALKSLQEGLEAVPGQTKLIDACIHYGKERLQAGDAIWAATFLSLALRYEGDNNESRRMWRISQSVNEVAGLLKETDAWGLAVECCQELLSVDIPMDVRSGVAKALKEAWESSFQSAPSAPNISVLFQMVQCASKLSSLDPLLREWTNSVQAQWPRWLNDLLVMRLKARGLESMVSQATMALNLGNDPASMALAMQPAIKLALEQIPPTEELARASRLRRLTQRIVELGGMSIDADFSAKTQAYTRDYQTEVRRRRQAALEEVEQFVLGLTAIDDVRSYQKAQEALAEALLLTPEDSETYPRLKEMEKRITERWEVMQSGGEMHSQIEAVLESFPKALGQARTEDEFAKLQEELNLALERSSTLGETSLIDQVGAALKQLETVRQQRHQVQSLEQELDRIRTRLTPLRNLGMGAAGRAMANDASWRKLKSIAKQILALHPYHSGALQALKDYDLYVQKVGPGERFRYLKEVEASLKPALGNLQWAKHYLSKGDFTRAQEHLDKLPEDWQELAEITQLKRDVEAMRKGLTPFQPLLQMDGAPDSRFHQIFQELVNKRVAARYWELSGVVQRLSTHRSELLQQLLLDKSADNSTVAASLAELAAVDQYYRMAQAQSREQSMPMPTTRPNVKSFVDNVLSARGEGALTQEGLEQNLEQMPLSANPIDVQKKVKFEAETWLKKYRRFSKYLTLPVILGAISGLILLAALGTVGTYVWPGFSSGSRPNIQKTATAYVQMPHETVVTVPVTVTPTPTNTPVPTNTPTPLPTNTPTLTPIPTPTATPISYLQPQRFERVSATLAEKPLKAPRDMTPMPADWVRNVENIAAVADDGDAESGLYRNGQRLDIQLPGDTAKGLFGGMHYLDATAPVSMTGQITTTAPISVTGQVTATDFYTWPVLKDVAPGSYHLLVYIPNAHGTAQVMYAVRQAAAGDAFVWQEQPLLQQKIVQNNFTDEWVDLGEFDIPEGAVVQVVAYPLTPLQDDKAIAFDAVALALAPPPPPPPSPSLPQHFGEVSTMLAETPLAVPEGVTPMPADWVTNTENIAAVADDGDAESGLYRDGQRLDIPLLGDTEKGLFGGMHYLDASTPISATGQITTTDFYAWPVLKDVAPGSYHLLVYIPDAHGASQVMYAVRQAAAGAELGGQEYPLLQQKLVQGNFTGKWVDLGEFEIPEGTVVQVVAYPLAALQGDDAIAFDAVALIHAPPAPAANAAESEATDTSEAESSGTTSSEETTNP